MARPFTPSFCAACGGPLRAPLPEARGGPPLVCSRCGQAFYQDPKLAVAVVLLNPAGEVILLRRAQRDQAHGRWILPGGHVDRGEELPSAALREVAEETGLRARLEGLVGVYSYAGYPVVLVVYAARGDGGQPRPGPEALEVRAFPPAAIPWDKLGYASTGDALRDFLGRGGGRPPA